MFGLLLAGFPKRALAIAVAVTIAATAFVAAPMPDRIPIVENVPVIGDFVSGSADAHTVQNCTTQWRTNWVQNSDGSWEKVSYPYRSCVNVPHAHRPPPPVNWTTVGVNLGCLGVSAFSFWWGAFCVGATTLVTAQQ